MKEIYFNDRKGNTVLSKKEQQGLKLKHITNMAELDEAEQININDGLIWLATQKGNYLSEQFFKRLHKKLFGQVWNWAGQYRTSEKNIGIDYWKIPTEVHKLCEDAKYWLENKSYSWIELISHFHHRLVYTHPFPNGNGRFSRIITNHLCKMNNEEKPSWRSQLNPHDRRASYIFALQQADVKKIDELVMFLSH